MARGPRGRGPQGPPPGGGVLDLSSLGEQQGVPLNGDPTGVYVNNFELSAEAGIVVLRFRTMGPDGASKALTIAMHPGLFTNMIGLGGETLEAAVEQMAEHAMRLGEAVAAGKAAAQRAGGVPPHERRESGPPTPIRDPQGG